MQLSFCGHSRAWETIREMMRRSTKKLTFAFLEANKGGMLVRVNYIEGFLPVSQLSPEHFRASRVAKRIKS